MALGLIDDMEKRPFTIGAAGTGSRELRPGGPRNDGPIRTPRGCQAELGRRARWRRDPVPLWLRDRRTSTGTSTCRARDVYVQFNQVGNKQDETIEAFAKRLFAFVEPGGRALRPGPSPERGGKERSMPLLLASYGRESGPEGTALRDIGRSTWSAAQGLVTISRNTEHDFVRRAHPAEAELLRHSIA